MKKQPPSSMYVSAVMVNIFAPDTLGSTTTLDIVYARIRDPCRRRSGVKTCPSETSYALRCAQS
jgi:hypothetical protein